MRDISLHLMDIAQNSVVAKAKTIEISFTISDNLLSFTIVDDGCGMSPEMVQKVFDPFVTSRTTRRVGLGIPLLVESTQATGGDVTIVSEVGVGTTLTATFMINHIDRIPLGDLSSTMAMLICSTEGVNFILTLCCENSNDETFVISTNQIKEILGDDVSLNEVQVIDWLTEFINENLKIIFGGILDEIVS